MITKRFTVVFMAMFAILLNVSAQKIMQKNSTELSQILDKDKKIVVLDVRTPQEFAAGHLKGALNIDIYQDNFYSRIDKLDKKATYLVYCRTSNRSTAAVGYMQQNGFKNLYQMMDGFPGWAFNKLPYEKAPNP
jgi:rhodanese-related sulfurtransferase